MFKKQPTYEKNPKKCYCVAIKHGGAYENEHHPGCRMAVQPEVAGMTPVDAYLKLGPQPPRPPRDP